MDSYDFALSRSALRKDGTSGSCTQRSSIERRTLAAGEVVKCLEPAGSKADLVAILSNMAAVKVGHGWMVVKYRDC